MPNVLKSALTFVGVAAGGQATLPHQLANNGVALQPSIISFDSRSPGFVYVASTSTTVTIQNNNLVPADCTILCEWWHTIERAFPGAPPPLVLPTTPVIVGESTAGGGGSSTLQAFTYTCTGAEGNDFMVPLPAARANDNYAVVATLSSVTATFALNCPDTLAGDRTTTEFRVITSAPVVAGDLIDFHVEAR